MVKRLVLLMLTHAVSLLELVGVVCLAIGLGMRFGAWTVLVIAGVALLVKSFELDLASGDQP